MAVVGVPEGVIGASTLFVLPKIDLLGEKMLCACDEAANENAAPAKTATSATPLLRNTPDIPNLFCINGLNLQIGNLTTKPWSEGQSMGMIKFLHDMLGYAQNPRPPRIMNLVRLTAQIGQNCAMAHFGHRMNIIGQALASTLRL